MEKKKLSYEELEAYAQQTINQAKSLYEENLKLKRTLEEARVQINYADINYAFKVLEFRQLFPEDFVTKVVNKLVVILTPSEDSEDSEEDNKKEE